MTSPRSTGELSIRLVLAELAIGEVQVVEIEALERLDVAGDRLRIVHRGVDQVVEVDRPRCRTPCASARSRRAGVAPPASRSRTGSNWVLIASGRVVTWLNASAVAKILMRIAFIDRNEGATCRPLPITTTQNGFLRKPATRFCDLRPNLLAKCEDAISTASATDLLGRCRPELPLNAAAAARVPRARATRRP